MGLRDDLLELAHQATIDGQRAEDPAHRAGQALAAKHALEAAALAQNTTPAQIDAALEGLQEQIEAVDLLPAALSLEPGEFLEHVLRVVKELAGEADKLSAMEYGYRRYHEVLTTLWGDFTAAGTETSMRLAARIQSAFDDVTDHLRPPRE